MADLSDRGQLILIAGFALAVTFVGLAVVLNSVIYTENLATRSESTTSDPVSHARSIDAGTVDLLESVNEYNVSQSPSYDALRTNLSRGFANLSEITTIQQLVTGQVVNDSLGSTYEGTWIVQTDETRDFTNDSDDIEWSLVEQADGARSFRVFVANTSELDGNSSFTVEATDANGSTWNMSIEPETVNGSGFSCDFGSVSSVWVNVSRGTVGGDRCSGLGFGSTIGQISNVSFSQAANIQGTYRLLANKSMADVNSFDFGSNTTSPFTRRAIYGATVDVDFERENLVYRTTLRVIPGERDG